MWVCQTLIGGGGGGAGAGMRTRGRAPMSRAPFQPLAPPLPPPPPSQPPRLDPALLDDLTGEWMGSLFTRSLPSGALAHRVCGGVAGGGA